MNFRDKLSRKEVYGKEGPVVGMALLIRDIDQDM